MSETTSNKPPETDIAGYIEAYPDNEFAKAKFTELFNLFTPVCKDPSFDRENELPLVLDQASRLMDLMIEHFGICSGCDPILLQRFIRDVGLCGFHAEKILKKKFVDMGIRK